MGIRCIALDLDWTTLNARGRLSERNREALERAIARGIHVAVASGRSLDSLPGDILDIPGIRYAITSNGAAVYDLEAGVCLHAWKMTAKSVEDILRLTESEPVGYEAFIDGRAYGQREYVEDPVSFGAEAASIPYIQSTRRPVADFRGFLMEHRNELDGMDVIVDGDATKQRLWRELSEQVEDIYVTSSVKQLLEISYKDSGKHSGVKFLLKHLGLKPEELAAFGDGDNDAEMLRYAGIGYAVANASETCRAAADVIAPHHDADAVAWGIGQILGN